VYSRSWKSTFVYDRKRCSKGEKNKPHLVDLEGLREHQKFVWIQQWNFFGKNYD